MFVVVNRGKFYHHANVVTASQIKYLVGQEKRKRPYQTEGQLTPQVLTLCLSSALWHLAHTFMKTVLKMGGGGGVKRLIEWLREKHSRDEQKDSTYVCVCVCELIFNSNESARVCVERWSLSCNGPPATATHIENNTEK